MSTDRTIRRVTDLKAQRMETYRYWLKDQREILAAFNAHGVKYLVIGGHAVSIHANPRGTKHLDLFIKTREENSKAVYAALAEFGAPLPIFTLARHTAHLLDR